MSEPAEWKINFGKFVHLYPRYGNLVADQDKSKTWGGGQLSAQATCKFVYCLKGSLPGVICVYPGLTLAVITYKSMYNGLT